MRFSSASCVSGWPPGKKGHVVDRLSIFCLAVSWDIVVVLLGRLAEVNCSNLEEEQRRRTNSNKGKDLPGVAMDAHTIDLVYKKWEL